MSNMNMSRSEWLLFLLLPLAVFPLFWMVASFTDWLVGDAKTIMRIIYDSRKELLIDFLQDWSASLLFSAFFVWLLYMPLYIFLKNKGFSKSLVAIFSGVLLGLLVGIVIYRFDIAGIVVAVMTGFIIGVCCLLLVRITGLWK
jgi:hypothetical protein